MKNRKYLIIPVITAILGFALITAAYVTNRAVPFMMDDLWYSTLLWEETPIASLRDIVRSQIWHYNNWGGRSITHSILQLTLLAGEEAADVLNVAVTLFLGFLMAKTAWREGFAVPGGSAEPRKSRSGFLLAGYLVFAGTAMLTGLNPNWKMSMFWQSGAANYLYITVFILGYLYCFLRELPDVPGVCAPDQKQLPGITFWIIPLGIFAGWSNENMGPAVWIASLTVTLLYRKEQGKIRPWMALGSLSCLVGSIVMIAAPGNFVRSARVEEGEYGFWWQCFLRVYAQGRGALEYLFPALLVLGAALLTGRALKLTLGRKNLILLFTALLSWGAMILSPHYPDRAAFGTMVLLLCVILNLGAGIYRERRELGLPLWCFTVLVWARGMYFMGEFLAISWGWIR